MHHAEIRGERGIGRVLHGDFHHAPLAGALALVKRGHDRSIEMDARAEIAQGGARLHRRLVGKAGRVDDAAHRLHYQVHGWIVPIGPRLAVAGARAVDQARIDLVQIGRTDPEAFGDAGREVLHQDVGARHHLAQEVAALLYLQIERDRLLVGVQHGERKRRPAHVAAAAQMLAVERLDLDDLGAGHGHQKGGIGPVVDVRKVDHRDPRQGIMLVGGRAIHDVSVLPAM